MDFIMGGLVYLRVLGVRAMLVYWDETYTCVCRGAVSTGRGRRMCIEVHEYWEGGIFVCIGRRAYVCTEGGGMYVCSRRGECICSGVWPVYTGRILCMM